MLTRPHRFRCVVLVVCLAICSIPAIAQEDHDSHVQRGREFLGLAPPPDPVAAARGQKLFTQNCAFCHGANATGAEGPDLVRSTVVLHDESGDQVGAVVLNGRPDRGMPAFPSFTRDQIADLAAFLHARVEAAVNRWGYKLLNVVTGNASQGKTFFDQHCSSCHSPSGDLTNIAKKFEPAELQAQFLYPSRSKTPTTIDIKLPSGEHIHGTLKRIDDFRVSMWDASGEYHSWSHDSVQIQIHDPLAAHQELLALFTNADMHNVLAYLETLK